MNLTVEIPDDLAVRLSAEGGDLSRRALEAFVIQEYRNERLSTSGMRELLGLKSRYELDGFLKAHDVFIEITVDEVLREVQTLERLKF